MLETILLQLKPFLIIAVPLLLGHFATIISTQIQIVWSWLDAKGPLTKRLATAFIATVLAALSQIMGYVPGWEDATQITTEQWGGFLEAAGAALMAFAFHGHNQNKAMLDIVDPGQTRKT